MDKYWRFTEIEFEEEIRNYIQERILFTENSNYKNIHSIDKRKSIRKAIINYIGGMIDNKTAMKKIVYPDVKNWSNLSLDLDIDPRRVILLVIASEIYGDNYICLSMLQNNPNLPNEVWEDISFIKSGLFTFDTYDDEHVFAIQSALESYRMDREKYNPKLDPVLLSLYDESTIKYNIINKSTWNHIRKDETVEEFIKRTGNNNVKDGREILALSVSN